MCPPIISQLKPILAWPSRTMCLAERILGAIQCPLTDACGDAADDHHWGPSAQGRRFYRHPGPGPSPRPCPAAGRRASPHRTGIVCG